MKRESQAKVEAEPKAQGPQVSRPSPGANAEDIRCRSGMYARLNLATAWPSSRASVDIIGCDSCTHFEWTSIAAWSSSRASADQIRHRSNTIFEFRPISARPSSGDSTDILRPRSLAAVELHPANRPAVGDIADDTRCRGHMVVESNLTPARPASRSTTRISVA